MISSSPNKFSTSSGLRHNSSPWSAFPSSRSHSSSSSSKLASSFSDRAQSIRDRLRMVISHGLTLAPSRSVSIALNALPW
jgi:hypothetical protein